ncbi:MAG: glycosyltransferase family 9 protein [Nitrosomonadales bacterium]
MAIHPHASKDERNWLPDRYAAVVEQSISRWQCSILLTGGNSPAERALYERLVQHAPSHILNLSGQTTLKQLAALLSLVDVLVAPRHRAQCILPERWERR